MTTPRDPDEILSAWLDEGPTRIPDQTRRAIVVAIPTTTQRRLSLRLPWRFPPMITPARVAVIAVVGALLIGGGYAFIGRSNTPVTGVPAVTSAPSTALQSATPSAPAAARVDAPGTIVYLRRDAATPEDMAYAMDPDGTNGRRLLSSTTCCLTLFGTAPQVLLGVDADGLTAPVIKPIGLGGYAEGPEDTKGMNLAPWATTEFDMAFEGWDDQDPSRTGIWLSIANGGAMAWGELRQITRHSGQGHDLPIAFSPDGQHLLFLRQTLPDGDLYIIGIDGKGLRKLNLDGTKVVQDAFLGAGATWSPDGARIAFAAYTNANTHLATVYVMDAAGGEPRVLAGAAIWTTSVAWSPDGRWIAFDRDNGTGVHDLYLVDPDDGSQTNLTFDFGPGVCCPKWSPDSRYLLVQGTTSDDEHSDLYFIAADGSGAVKVTDQPGVYTSYAWSPATTKP